MNVNIGLALAIIVALPPLALCGVLGLAEVVFIHEVAEVAIIANGLRAGLRRRSQMLLLKSNSALRECATSLHYQLRHL